MDRNENYNPQADENRIRNVKVIAIVIMCALVAVFFLYFLFVYLDTGHLVVNTKSNYQITVTKINDSNTKNPFSKTAVGHLATSLKAGKYLVSISGSLAGGSKEINISARKTTTITLNPLAVSVVEPVSSNDSEFISASNSSLYYIDGPDGNLYNVNSSNDISVMDGGQQIQSAQWSSTVGVGVAQTPNGSLFNISGQNVSPIKLPVQPSSQNPINYGVAPNGTLFVSSGKTVYVDSGGQFKKIYTASNNSPTLVAYNNKVAVIVPQEDSNQTDNDSTRLAIVDTSGKVVSQNINANQAVWSPSGKYLAISGSSNEIIDGTTMQEVSTIPINGGAVSDFQWLSDNSLLYGLGSGIWLYNLQSGTSQMITNVSTIGYVSEITLNQDNSYIYTLVQNNGGETGSYQLVRFGLDKGSTVPAIMQQLQVYLPNTYQGCFITYLNFTSPTILSSSTDSTSSCIPQAQAYLKQYQVNTASLNFENSPRL